MDDDPSFHLLKSSMSEFSQSQNKELNNINNDQLNNLLYISSQSLEQTVNRIGIENRSFEKNCFINVCIQTIIHFHDLRTFLLNKKKFIIFENTPLILKELINLLNQYKIFSNVTPNNNKKIIDPYNFRIALSNHFSNENIFQLGSEGDPMELLQILFKFFHSYLNSNFKEIDNPDKICDMCEIHNLFFIDIVKESKCDKCNYNNIIKYDSNYFFHLINVSNILEIVKKNNLSFYDFIGKLIHCSSLDEKLICNKCKQISLTEEFKCKRLGKYLMINLIWEQMINFENLLIILCMITNHFQPQDLFTMENNIRRNYKFLGMLVFYLDHYICFFYQKKNRKYILYDDKELLSFNSWHEIIEKIIEFNAKPIAIFYEDNNDNYCKWDINLDIYNKLLFSCKEKDKNKEINNNNLVPLNDNEWDCQFCQTINYKDSCICKKCNKKNNVIEMLILQNMRNREIEQKNNYDDSPKIWKCPVCLKKYQGDKCPTCNRRNFNSNNNYYTQDKYWKCAICNNLNIRNNLLCKTCGNKKKE